MSWCTKHVLGIVVQLVELVQPASRLMYNFSCMSARAIGQ